MTTQFTNRRIKAVPRLKLINNEGGIYKILFSAFLLLIVFVNPMFAGTPDRKGIARVFTNHPPIAIKDEITTDEDVPVSGNLLDNDFDPDGGEIYATEETKTSNNGQLVIHGDGTFTYTPNPNFHGVENFTYSVCDHGLHGSEDGCTSGNVEIVVNSVQDAPIGNPDFFSIDEDTQLNTAPNSVLTNDVEVDGENIHATIGKPTEHGTVKLNPDGTFTYQPKPNFNGTDTFTYYANDGIENSDETLVTITVVPVSEVPIATPDRVTTPEDTPIIISVLSNDTGDNALDVGSVVLVAGPSHGSVVVQPATGTFTYTPDKDFNGTDSYTYTVKDVVGTISAPGTVTITVTPVNDAPVAVNDAATTNENVPVDIPVLANDFDVDNTVVITSLTISASPQHGTVSINTSSGVATYTPQANFSGQDSFNYTIKDQSSIVSLPASVTITVIDINLPPVAVDDGPIIYTLISALTIDVLANDYDPDNLHSELSILSVSNPPVGSVSIVNGKIVFQPEGMLSTIVTFTYTITDPDGLTDDAIVTIDYRYSPITVSQGFSPNGDGNNDTWFIQGIESHPNNSVKVYNRSGLMVYQKSGYENILAPWDGRGNTGQFVGKLMELGTYFYVLNPGDGMKNLEGYLVIIR